MAARHKGLFVLGLALVACSGASDRQTNRNLGTGRDASAADADAADEAEPDPESDADIEPRDAETMKEAGEGSSPAPLDAAVDTGTTDAGPGATDAEPALLDADSDADLNDAGDASEDITFRIRVIVDNPHGHENPIAFAWGGDPVEADDDGFVYADTDTLPDKLELWLGESDETVVKTFFGVENGDELHFLYRHFREPAAYRPVTLPPDLPTGTTSLTLASAVRSESVSSTQTMASVYFYLVGASPYLAEASGASGVLGYATAASLEPPTTQPFPPLALAPWVAPRTISVALNNAPAEVSPELFIHKGGAVFPASTASTPTTFSVPPGFADFLEARVKDTTNEQEHYVTRLISRCGPEADSVALDFADALPPTIALAEDHGATITWTFETPPAEQRGDLLIFDSVVMPATQTSVTLPDDGRTSHVLMRVDVGSISSLAQLKREVHIDLALLQTSPWCQGTDHVRVTHVEWQTP